MARLRYYVTESNLKLVYNSIILPLFDYADVVYDSASKKYINQLQKLQNRAGRIILKVKPLHYTSNKQIHNRLEWMSLQSRRNLHINTIVFKCLHNMAPLYLTESFQFCNYVYNLRSKGNVTIPKPNTESCRRMFLYRGSKKYNEIPSNIKLANNFNTFLRFLLSTTTYGSDL